MTYDASMPSFDRALAGLESLRRSPPDPARLIELLAALDRTKIRDADRLALLHDALLFLCAYPPTPGVLRLAESILKRFAGRMRDIDPLLDPEVSGIAGTWVEMVFSFDFVRWLARRFPRQVDIDWDEPPDSDRLAAVLAPRIPFLEEEVVDVHVPTLEIAQQRGLAWLLQNLEPLAYDSLGLWVRWKPGAEMSRTLMRRPPRTIFLQSTPPLSRRDVSIERELAGPPLRISRLSRRKGQAVLDMVCAALATRYRELYNFTWGDPSTVLSADAGRGLEILLIGLLPEKRLPLRAGFAPFLLRNGVPIGYGDAFGLCERMEVSFNIFYAFRDGESAFCFVRLLKLYHQLFGSTVFSIDPYQIGLENEEAIEAGAFWFYRKLGFRSTDPRVERIARHEEERMTKDPTHRTSARTLRRMAQSPLIYEMQPTGAWDRFRIHNVVRKLGSGRRQIRIPPEILRAKSGRSEVRYVRLLARHKRFRRAILQLGRD